MARATRRVSSLASARRSSRPSLGEHCKGCKRSPVSRHQRCDDARGLFVCRMECGSRAPPRHHSPAGHPPVRAIVVQHSRLPRPPSARREPTAKFSMEPSDRVSSSLSAPSRSMIAGYATRAAASPIARCRRRAALGAERSGEPALARGLVDPLLDPRPAAAGVSTAPVSSLLSTFPGSSAWLFYLG
jgi:hypothetical protein